ncbi:MAG: hypothetical protein ABI199_02515 [Bacteroidia bacterium]
MGTFFYAIVGLFWAFISLSIGKYITGSFFNDRKQITIGLGAIVASCLLGLCFLFVIITHL